MLYYLIRPMMKIRLLLFYKKIYLSGLENIPKDKPIILAANHPTAFVEPCLLACWLPNSIHSIVRGDIFKNPFVRKVLAGIHLIPMFRLKDGGYKVIKNNYDSISVTKEKILDGNWLLILAEGSTRFEKRLRPLQKGTARLAFNAIDDPRLADLQIIPIGVNYTYSDKDRSEVMIHLAKPISVMDYKTSYEEHANKAIVQLTSSIQESMSPFVVQVRNQEDEDLTENLLSIYRVEEDWSAIKSDDVKRIQKEKELCDRIEQMEENKKSDLNQKVRAYCSFRDSLGVSEEAFSNRGKPHPLTPIAYFLSYPGKLFFALPQYLAIRLTNSFKLRREFLSSILLGSSLGLYIIYFFLIILFFAIYWPKGFLFLLLAIAWGLWYSKTREDYDYFKIFARFAKLSESQKSDLIKLRTQVIDAYEAEG